MKIKTADVIYEQKIYPRDNVDMKVVAQYRDSIENLPAIVVDKKNRIIDGYHRLLAYRQENIEEIEAELFDSDDDGLCLLESLKRNSKHGKQLSIAEKKKHARELYKRRIPEADVIGTLSISVRTLRSYLEDIKEKEEEGRNQRILEMYLACWTVQEIADDVGIDKSNVSREISKLQNGKLAETQQPPEPLQYTNLWSFNNCNPDYGDKYPGRMPGQIIENLLWYYTEPFDVVIDPMAGSGTTVDVCKKMYRRYIAYDINPIETQGIKKHNILMGFPERKIKDKPKLIVLDPPYSIQKKGEYTAHPDDLSNLPLEKFYDAIKLIAKGCKKELDENGIVAFIISSLKNNGQVVDLAVDCRNIFVDAGFVVLERICVPYNNASSTTGFWIKDAKENKRMLRAYRDLLIMKVG